MFAAFVGVRAARQRAAIPRHVWSDVTRCTMEKTYLTCYTKKKGRGTPEFRFCFLSLCFLQFWKWLPVLKKSDWHERGPVTDQSHDRSGQPDKRGDKKLGQKSSNRQSSNARHLGCVFQDMKPPKSILRKSSDMQKPIQRVKVTKAIARHTKIRDQNPSLGYICPGEPHQRSPNAPKFEDRSLEETEWQEQGAREAAWKLAKSVLKLKETNKEQHSSHLRKIGACLHQR